MILRSTLTTRATLSCLVPHVTAMALTAACASTSTPRAVAHVEVPPAPPAIAMPPSPGRLDARVMALALEGHGRWIETPRYGPVWQPDAAREPTFVPYLTRGRWVASSTGWFWRSDDAWGAITFHYGRWASIDGAWTWVPGAAFSPAWVSWREGNGWVGWTPSPPEGDTSSAPFVYVSADSLGADGVAQRAVQGAAAVSLFALTPSAAAPSTRSARSTDEVWRASLNGPLALALSFDGEVAARLALPEVPAVREGSPSRSIVLGRSYEVARVGSPPTHHEGRVSGYAPVHMPPPYEAWPVPGSFRYGATLRGTTAVGASLSGASQREIYAITPTFSGTPTATAQPVEVGVVGGGPGLSTPPPAPASTSSGSPTLAE